MEALIPQPLQSSDPKALYNGLYKILNGIMIEFGFQQTHLAKILHKPPTTINGWFNRSEVKVSKGKYTPDDVQVYELIELYDSISSYFVKTEDQVRWLKADHDAFGGKSPLVYMYEHPSHLRDVRQYLEARMNP